MKIILDCNVYDRLEKNVEFVCVLQECIKKSKLSVLVTPSLWREIQASPHTSIAWSLPVTYIGESLARAGGQIGDRVGSGELFLNHLGHSNKYTDALIADAAHYDADYLVTEDIRLAKRMDKFSFRCVALNYSEFQKLVHSHENFEYI